MKRTEPSPLLAHHGEVSLAGSLWLPDVEPRALLLMHPGSGPSDRDNDVYFPPIRVALLDAGVAVASYDKRGVGGSGGSWLDAGIEEQAGDLLAGLAAAGALVPGVPRGAFGHSQGGWVALEAAHLAGPAGLDFAITSSGPAVTVGAQERYSADCTLARSGRPEAARARARAAIDGLFRLMESGGSHKELLGLLGSPERAADLSDVLGDDVPDERLWGLFVRLAGYDPLPALRAMRVPLLAAFGGDDDVTPTEASVAVLRETVDPALLQIVVLPGGGHRMAPTGERAFVTGYPDAVVDFVRAQGS